MYIYLRIMDSKILKAILDSCESVTKDIENVEDYKKLLQEETFLPTSNIILHSVCTSITKLLYYKVSKKAYQRYSVRLHIIDVLRDWCRITNGFQQSRTFTNETQTLNLIKALLEKHLTDDILKNCATDDNLLPLATALMCLASDHPSYTQHVDKILTRLSKVELSSKGETLLCYAVSVKCDINLNLSTVEAIYTSQKSRLIEEPIFNHFISCHFDLSKAKNGDSPVESLPVNRLFKYASESGQIFQLLCVVLKELFTALDYSPIVLEFTESVVKHIAMMCKHHGKNILDLYPKRFQSGIIMLGIEPSYHTVESRGLTLRFLQKVFDENKKFAMILLSHFPAWLHPFNGIFCTEQYSNKYVKDFEIN